MQAFAHGHRKSPFRVEGALCLGRSAAEGEVLVALILDLLDRAFYAASGVFAHKPGASIAVARRAGTVASFDVLNKYFTINQMPIVSSNYWNDAFGAIPGEDEKDEEGMQVMRVLGNNMAWLLKCIEAGKAAGIEAPAAERKIKTNFIR